MAQRLKRLPAMWETWVRSLGREDPLETEMATHSSIHARKIPWTKEPSGLQSMGCKESDMTGRLHFHFTFSIQNKKFKMWEKIVWEFGYITGAKCLREIYLVKYVNYLDVNQKINKNNCLKLYVK